MKVPSSLIISLAIIGFWGCTDSGNPIDSVIDDCGVANGDNSTCVNYSTEIQPIFSTNNLCTSCHGVNGDLTLDSYTTLMASNVVIPGDSTGSLIIKKLKEVDAVLRMPKGKDPLDNATITLIATWIYEGANDN